MASLQFSYQASCLVTKQTLDHLNQRLLSEINTLEQSQSDNYNTPYAFLNIPNDLKAVQATQELINVKQKLNPQAIIVIGIGGSCLGPRAVQEALFGTYYNAHQPDIAIYYADTVDTDYVYDILLLTEQLLIAQETVLINIISKSGTTTETVANAQLFIELLKHYYADEYHHYVVVTTDKDSALWKLAETKNFARLEIPARVGGRYSVLSPVGLFALGLIGVNIVELLEGAKSINASCLSTTISTNPAAMAAACLYSHYENNVNIHDSFFFSVDLEGIGKWYRQLMGESIGKQKKENNIITRVGITPTVSIGSNDLHSVAQLYLAGPAHRFTSFVSVEKNNSDLVVPKYPEYTTLVKSLENKSLPHIMKAIYQGTTIAYHKRQLPFIEIVWPKKSAFYVGQFLQYSMIQMVYLGYLLDINPFDQPEVELYKQETRKILAHE